MLIQRSDGPFREGTVITYRDNGFETERLVTHRIESVTPAGYMTKGDANDGATATSSPRTRWWASRASWCRLPGCRSTGSRSPHGCRCSAGSPSRWQHWQASCRRASPAPTGRETPGRPGSSRALARRREAVAMLRRGSASSRLPIEPRGGRARRRGRRRMDPGGANVGGRALGHQRECRQHLERGAMGRRRLARRRREPHLRRAGGRLGLVLGPQRQRPAGRQHDDRPADPGAGRRGRRLGHPDQRRRG